VPLDSALLTENFGSGLTELQAGYWSTSDVLDPSETIGIVLCDRSQPRQGFCDQELDSLFTDAIKEMDPAKREQLYFRLQDRANEIAYWIPLFYFPNRFAYYDYVKNFSVLPTGNVRLWEVKIEK
jgi:peptide/nickel transport system substrate-binding protein